MSPNVKDTGVLAGPVPSFTAGSQGTPIITLATGMCALLVSLPSGPPKRELSPHDPKCSISGEQGLVWGDPLLYLRAHHAKPKRKKKKSQQLEAADHYHKQILITYLILLLNKKTGNRR